MFGNFGADVVVQADFQPSGEVEIHELRIKCVFVGLVDRSKFFGGFLVP